MTEFVTTRHNELIDPVLHAWGWEIPLYLFLGGLVAGMMIISGYFIFTGRTQHTKCSCFLVPLVAIGAISIGMLFLFLDLEHKIHVWRLYLTFAWKSPMSWGAWILLLIYPILILNALIRLPEELRGKSIAIDNLSDRINRHPFFIKTIGSLSMITGGMLGIYTGVLLSSMASRPAWNSGMLWTLFLVSGLSSAAAFIHMVARLEDERKLLAKADNGFLITELFILVLMIISLGSSSGVEIDAARLILGGPFTSVFWIFVVGIGIVVPLIIQLFAVNNKVQHTAIPPLMVIFGGIILRFVIVEIGQYSAWSTSTFHLP